MALGCGQGADWNVKAELGAYGKEKRGGLQRDYGMIPSHDKAASKRELWQLSHKSSSEKRNACPSLSGSPHQRGQWFGEVCPPPRVTLDLKGQQDFSALKPLGLPWNAKVRCLLCRWSVRTRTLCERGRARATAVRLSLRLGGRWPRRAAG